MVEQTPVQGVATQLCPICLHSDLPLEKRRVRSNVRRFRDREFLVWRCTQCQSLHCEKVHDLASYYENYPIRNQVLDYFLRSWYRVILKRLVKAGLKKQDRILDYGCNKGLFIEFLEENGYRNCFGYDPYVDKFNSIDVLDTRYDLVVSLDVIEHDESPRDFLAQLAKMVKPGGLLCIETPNAEGILLANTEEYLHSLHMPYHVHIFSQWALANYASQLGLNQIAVYNRWYMDSWPPGTARRLFESLMMFSGNDLDSGYESPRISLFFEHPVLLFYLFFGYFLPAKKHDHMMMVFISKP